MSMFGSLEQDYEAWKKSAGERGLEFAIADDYERLIDEAFYAGAASVLGGVGVALERDGRVGSFLNSYRDQVTRKLAELGIEP